ncbi:MAG: hypothetical protein KUG74_15720 [Rhodobacteraceae bacterium]|nr:hypothetical protein [Paracoccaceae bacterium]
MKNNLLWAAGAALTLAACSGGNNDGCTYTPLLGNVGSCDAAVDDGTTTGTDNGTGATAKLLSGAYAASRIEYDASTDQLIVESLPFDDNVFEGRYDRRKAFDVPGFKAYRSIRGFDNYIAYYGTSSTGNVSTAIVAQDGYRDHGHAGAGYARKTAVNLPSSTQKAYFSGSYVGLRTFNDPREFLDTITGNAQMEADFSDGKVRGWIRNRIADKNISGDPVRADISLLETDIDTDEAIFSGFVEPGFVKVATDPDPIGTYYGLFGGPDGKEIAGVVVIEVDGVRETGSFVAEQ